MIPVPLPEFLVFITASLALNLTPGPDMLYVASRSIGQGRSAGVISALGVGAGCLVHLFFAAFGLSALINYSANAFTIIKLVGAIYLIYLAITTWRAGASSIISNQDDYIEIKKTRLFLQGALTNILNPKVALFFLSFLPQFVDPTIGSATTQIFFLGSCFIVTGTIVTAGAGLVVGMLSGWLVKNPNWWKWQQRVTASILGALGLRLLFSENR